MSYLRDVESDETGREFLAEHLPDWWSRHLFLQAFEHERIGEIRATLAEVAVDEAGPFVEALLRRADGPGIHSKWLQLMGSRVVTYLADRDDLLTRLIQAVAAFQTVFPEQLRPFFDQDFDMILWALTITAPNMNGWLPNTAQFYEIGSLFDDASERSLCLLRDRLRAEIAAGGPLH
jgi:hypothetical protein